MATCLPIFRPRLHPLPVSFANQGQHLLSSSTSAGRKALTPVWKRGAHHEKTTQPTTFPFSCFPAGKEKGEEATDSGDSHPPPATYKQEQATISQGTSPPPPAKGKEEPVAESANSQLSPPLSPINLTLSQMNIFAADSEVDGGGSSVGRPDSHGACSHGSASEIAIPGDDREVNDSEQLEGLFETEGMEERCGRSQPASDVFTDASGEHWSNSTVLAVKEQATGDVVDSESPSRITYTPDRDVRQGSTGWLQQSVTTDGPTSLPDTTQKHAHDFLTEIHPHTCHRAPNLTRTLDSVFGHSSVGVDEGEDSSTLQLDDCMVPTSTGGLNRMDTVGSGMLMTSLPRRERMEESSDGVCSASSQGNAAEQPVPLAIHTKSVTAKEVEVVDDADLGRYPYSRRW